MVLKSSGKEGRTLRWGWEYLQSAVGGKDTRRRLWRAGGWSLEDRRAPDKEGCFGSKALLEKFPLISDYQFWRRHGRWIRACMWYFFLNNHSGKHSKNAYACLIDWYTMVVSAAVGNTYLGIRITSALIKWNGMNQLCQILQKSKRVRTEKCSLDVLIFKRTCQATVVK